MNLSLSSKWKTSLIRNIKFGTYLLKEMLRFLEICSTLKLILTLASMKNMIMLRHRMFFIWHKLMKRNVLFTRKVKRVSFQMTLQLIWILNFYHQNIVVHIWSFIRYLLFNFKFKMLQNTLANKITSTRWKKFRLAQ